MLLYLLKKIKFIAFSGTGVVIGSLINTLVCSLVICNHHEELFSSESFYDAL